MAIALIRHNQHPVAVCADYTGAADSSFNILMLMSMEHELRPRSLDVLVECRESHVHVVLAIMDQPRGVVGDENINCSEVGQKVFDFEILKQIVATRLIFPGPAESTKAHPTELQAFQMQILDRLRKSGA